MQLLFYTRLVLYLLAFGLPALHPAVAVPYDRYGWWLCFFLIPGEMLIGFYLAPPRLRPRVWLASAAGLLLISILVLPGLSRAALIYLGAGGASFVLTALIFKTGSRGHPLAVAEQFLLLFLYHKLLSFSRSSEAVAGASAGLNQAILFLVVCTFILHGAVLYLAAYAPGSPAGGPRAGRRTRLFKEPALFLALVVPAALLVALLAPRDFVSHARIFNILKQEPRPRPIPIQEHGRGVPGGNLRPSGQDDLLDGWRRFPGGREGRQGKEPSEGMLEGVPADQWGRMGKDRGAGNRQIAVMIVASPRGPVYAAEGYFERFDPERGFLPTPDQPLNNLVTIRLLERWEEKGGPADLKRTPREICYFSTIPDRVLAYRPRAIQPTVFDRTYHPFDYSYDSVSLVSMSGPRDWVSIRGLGDRERESLEKYLEVPLPEWARGSFEDHLSEALEGSTGYFEKITGILRSFSGYQYELGFDDDVSVAAMEEFLARSRRGDCTEFSNTAAILARLAGIPSRVVTGYLASDELQGDAHRRGVRLLRETVEPLQRFPLNSLYLVTDAHHHSWVQLYLPGYGWVDFESTAFAVPPAGGMGLGSMKVVIPLVRVEENVPPFRFPWKPVLGAAALLLALVLAGLCLFRHAAQLALRLRAGGRSEEALRSRYRLLLMKLSASRYTLKAPSATALEYAESYPELHRFAFLYTVLRYRRLYRPGERARLWEQMVESYETAARGCRKPGLLNALRRTFSLRSLYYTR
jgi:hypothetical protein